MFELPPTLDLQTSTMSSSLGVTGGSAYGVEMAQRAIAAWNDRQRLYLIGASGAQSVSQAPTANQLFGFDVVDRANLPVSLVAIKRLRTMRGYDGNWDGEGAPAPEADLIDMAITLVGFLAQEGLQVKASLDGEGRPMLLLSRGADEGEVTVTGDGQFEFAWFAAGNAFGGCDVEFDGKRLPNELLGAVARRELAAA